MLVDAFRYPLSNRVARDAVAVCTGLVLATLLFVRIGGALWPSLVVVVPAVLAVAPAALFAGYLGTILTPDAPDDSPMRDATRPFSWSPATLWTGLRLLVVTGVYLLPAGVALALTAFVLVGGGGGGLLTIAPTVALLVTVASVYVLPAALAASVQRGLRSGISRASLGGLASGSYFFAWTVSTALVVSAWSLLVAVAAATPAAVLLAILLAYVHIVAARLLCEGLSNSRWEPAA